MNCEVNLMEKEQNMQAQPQQQMPPEKPVYVPRPLWQVIGAWIGLVLFLLVVAAFYIRIAKGGL